MGKILVTGSSGFVGSHLVEELLWQTDHEIYAGVRATSSRKYLQDDRIRFFEIDLNNLSDAVKRLQETSFEYVYHNAGMLTALDEKDLMRVNAEMTRKFYEILAALPSPPKKFIFTSSVAAAGPADFHPEGIVRRDSPPHPVTHYGRSKLKAESYIQSDRRIPYIIMRPTAVYGPRDYEMLRAFKMNAKGWNVQLGKEDREYTFVYVKDLVRLMRLSGLSEMKNKIYFAASAETYSLTDLANFAARNLGRKTRHLILPMPIVRIAARFSELGARLSKKASVFNLDKMNELERISWKMDVSPQRDELGYTDQYSLEEGVSETIDWYRKHKWI